MPGFMEKSAKTLYDSLKHRRDPFLRRAEDAAAVTIPMLVPKEKFSRDGHQIFETPAQGLGARGVNHLGSRLQLTLLPANSPFFRLDMDKASRDVLKDSPEELTEVEKSLRDSEDAVRREIESNSMRVASGEMFKQLIVAGNVCKYYTDSGSLTYFPLSQFVCERDAEGDSFVLLVIREVLSEISLPDDMRELVAMRGINDSDQKQPGDGETSVEIADASADIEIYTRVWRQGERYRVRQELSDGFTIPGTEGSFSPEMLPYRPLRWTKVFGEAYGRGLVEEIRGDLLALEALAGAMVDGALAASRVVGLVAPNGQTQARDLNEARNGEFVSGRADDISFLQVDKQADFRFVSEAAARVESRVEASFLLNSSVIRDAERVTAEEIRFAAQELESTLGGVFSTLAQEFQLPLVTMVMERLRKRGQIPELSKEAKNHIKPVIITGADALGRVAELDRIRAAFGTVQGIVGPEQVAMATNLGVLLDYVFTQAGVRIEGLTKTKEQMDAERAEAQQAAMLQDLLKSGTGPLINQVGAGAREGAPQAES